MKHLIITFFSFCVLFSGFSQKDTIYYNGNWKEISSAEGAKYYRIQKKIDQKIFVKDYWLTGELQMEGEFTNDTKKESRNGHFIYYSKNGNIDWEVTYKNGLKDGVQKTWYGKDSLDEIKNYRNGKLHGDLISFFENGDTSYIESYKMGNNIGISKDWYRNRVIKKVVKYDVGGVDSVFLWYENSRLKAEGVVNDLGPYYIKYGNFWDDKGNQLIINGNGRLVVEGSNSYWEGNVKDGFLDGVMKKFNYDKKNVVIGKMKFVKGVYKKGYHLFNGKKIKIGSSFETDPVFRGGEKKMNLYISKGLLTYLYGNNCKNIIYNKVYVQFVVMNDGAIKDIEIIYGKTTECQKKGILKMFEKMPNWTPGSQLGFFVNVRFIVPINFKN